MGRCTLGAKTVNADVPLQKIVSGGQTGVDRAALDAAIAAGIPTGGWCPGERRAEDGQIPEQYPLQETASRSYAVRTEWNVRDSDGTLILVLDRISSGTKLTLDSARNQNKPVFVEYLASSAPRGLLGSENSRDEQIESVVDWLRRHKICTLNVAGPRGSSSAEVYPRAFSFMAQLLARLARTVRPGRGPSREKAASADTGSSPVRKRRKKTS